LGQSFAARSLGVLLFLAVAAPLEAQSGAGYVGAEACAKCHTAASQEWAASRHAKMMQPASARSVQGDFEQARVALRGSTFLLRQAGGNYFITESDLTGQPWEHRVEYTLGDRRIQHYLTTLPDGRIIVLPATWDIARKKWVHNLDIENPEEAGGDAYQVWNQSCYGCHVSREQKNFDVSNLSYHTTWQNFGINCESCHGPGSEHIAKATGVKAMSAEARAAVRKAIVNPARLDAARSTMVCAQCHSFRDIYADGFPAGANYYDYLLPVLEFPLLDSEDPAYWADGRPRWLSNEAFGLWQSQCYLKGGATCVTCHSHGHTVNIERNAQLRPANNQLCARCHGAIAANVSAHSHHAATSAGSSCVECHMPPTVVSLKARIRDHSIGLPVPENTIGHGIPNACNVCHKDKDAEWALGRMTAWYGKTSRQKFIRRADAFTAARKGDAAAVPALLEIAADASGGPWIRANAVGYLGRFPDDPAAYEAVLHGFSDSEALVRATAATSIRPRAAQRAEVAPELVALLQDPVRTVEVSAAIALVAIGVQQLPGEDGQRFERAKEVYRARAALNSDAAGQQFAAGKFFFLSGDMDGAVEAFRNSMKLDPGIPAQYLLARALAQKGDFEPARSILNEIPRNNPDYAAAQRLLAEVEAQESSPKETHTENAGTQTIADAQGRFLEGQLQYQNESYGAALATLEEALRLEPQATWAAKARIYRAICLERLARTSEAEAAMQALSEEPAARNDVDLEIAYAELLSETSRPEEGLKHLDGLIAAVPDAPMAYFWRAKLLLELHRTDEAARAAEESIHLLPQLPQAHNLLLRIYLKQGRTKEAAQQAEWLRDYERRMQSR
jgi:tetratricopeptide (TPR) repeat protein